jgi:hypothetical protein
MKEEKKRRKGGRKEGRKERTNEGRVLWYNMVQYLLKHE